jgi:hypothetical protein
MNQYGEDQLVHHLGCELFHDYSREKGEATAGGATVAGISLV